MELTFLLTLHVVWVAMAAVATTLPLYWNLASASKKERLDASVKLVSALQQFQSNYIPEAAPESESEKNTDDEEEGATSLESEYKTYLKKLQAENAADVAYAVQRLVRGLGSPRESSRLGFAVALTEVSTYMAILYTFTDNKYSFSHV